MIIQEFETEREWLDARMGNITGSKVVDVISDKLFSKREITDELDLLGIKYKKNASIAVLESMLPPESYEKLKKNLHYKIGVYGLVAERIAIENAGDLGPMERGSYLEPLAIDRFRSEMGLPELTEPPKKLIWIDEQNEAIRYSPDHPISETEVLEVKCLASARHVEVFMTKKVPAEYREQNLQAFLVNPKLETLYMAFFDPRMLVHDFFYLTIKRDEAKVAIRRAQLNDILTQVDRMTNELLGL